MDKTPHYHVVAFCRHCTQFQNAGIAKSLEDARKHVQSAPAEYGLHNPGHQTSGVVLDDDIARIRLDDHDIIMFTTQCHQDWQGCWEALHQTDMMMRVKEKLEEFAAEFLSGLQEDGFNVDDVEVRVNNYDGPQHKNEQPDKSANILNQIDLPDDFFGNQAH